MTYEKMVEKEVKIEGIIVSYAEIWTTLRKLADLLEKNPNKLIREIRIHYTEGITIIELKPEVFEAEDDEFKEMGVKK